MTDTKYSLTLKEHEKGTLNLGGYSKENPPPPLTIEIHATNRDLVKYEEKRLGSAEYFTLIYEVENRNDSPAFFDVVTEEADDEE